MILQIVPVMEVVTKYLLPAEMDLYAVAYRPVRRGERAEIDVWTARCAVGEPLPVMPLRLVGDLFIPGLAYWRVVQILNRSGDAEQADQLRASFRAEAEALTDKLPDPDWRKAYTNIWYHAALLHDNSGSGD